ncbi:MAG: GNAT family N-acetyltransferase [Bryobacteraceae bacterium]
MFQIPIRPDVQLRLMEQRHAAEAFSVVDRNRAYLREWLPWVDRTTSTEDTSRFIQSALEQYARNDGFHAGIWLQERFSGVIGCHKIDWNNRRVELGYWLAQTWQGRGIMTECCRAVVDYAFREWELNRVQIRCATDNVRSCAIPRRLGFTLEGVLRQAERAGHGYRDLNVFGLLAREWPHA